MYAVKQINKNNKINNKDVCLFAISLVPRSHPLRWIERSGWGLGTRLFRHVMRTRDTKGAHYNKCTSFGRALSMVSFRMGSGLILQFTRKSSYKFLSFEMLLGVLSS